MNAGIGKERSAYWDNIKGFLILLVVFAHILFTFQDKYETINSIVDSIYMFHMPAFVFVSGYFGKSERAHSFENIIRLIFLYFIFNSITGFLFGFDSLLKPVYSYWYLIALVVWRCTAHHIARFKESRMLLFAAALLAGFFPSIDNTFAAARIIGFYPFYLCGYQLSCEKSAAMQQKQYWKRAAVGLGILAADSVLAFFAYRFFHMTDEAMMMEDYFEPMDAFGRIVLYIIAFSAIYVLRCLAPDKKIPLLTMFGRNSLWIFILHRPLTLLIRERMIKQSVPVIIVFAVCAALLMCLLFGNRFIVKYLDRFLSDGTGIFLSDHPKMNAAKLAVLCVSFGFVISAVSNAYNGLSFEDVMKFMRGESIDEPESDEDDDDDVIYPVMTTDRRKCFDDAFRITFAGDLILLEDQVKRAYRGNGYDFTDVFEYAAPYIASADLAIGVFEGPMAGKEEGYTSSNFDDGKDLRLNFPDEFASAVKDAGFDLVTTANNHLLDKGEKGALRTIEVLDRTGLDHTGSYLSADDKKQNRVKIVECQGIKIAVLSYTYGSNLIETSDLIEGKYAYLTSVIEGTEGEQFEMLKQNVEEDFEAAKALSPDLIVVLPHIGTQFSNEADEEQKVWFEIFRENGADIILGDHPHVVEPVLLEDYQGKKVFTAYCPGNFANIYRENQGDTSMLTDVYIDRETKEVIGGSIVPLYTHSPADGNYRAVPIYDIMHDKELRKQLTTDDIDRAADANHIITEVVFGHKMDITAVTERLYFDENGFLRSKAEGLTLRQDMKEGTLWQAMEQAGSICFVGDSVTEGTKNGGCPWYEPIEAYFRNKEISNYSKGGCTVSYMVKNAERIPKADLYVIALGTNDVRYRDETVCAMDAEEFTNSIGTLREKLLAGSPEAKFVFIAPWYSTDGDLYSNLSYRSKTEMNEEYSDALEQYCAENKLGFINANDEIREILSVSPQRNYLLDHIHPNASSGVVMYSEAVLSN